MKKEINGIIYILAILVQFYVGVTLLATPEKAHMGHYLVVLLISIPMIVDYVKDFYK